jgi:hypothetical protein
MQTRLRAVPALWCGLVAGFMTVDIRRAIG